ncbi:predicted protein [Mycobacterium tuberculosis 94_M4241A]|nr:predicted protein [Mycobacterium tuberculosis 94_M4241A]
MQRRRIADGALHGRHRLDGGGVHRGGGSVIQVGHDAPRILARAATQNVRAGHGRSSGWAIWLGPDHLGRRHVPAAWALPRLPQGSRKHR